jgi:tetratricopeptide (TPR) repeat protein
MAVLIPVGLAWMISSASSQARQGLISWLIGAVIVEILSFSRGGLLSLAASLPTFAALVILGSADWRERAAGALRDRRVQAGLASAALFALLLAFLWARQTGLGGHRAGDQARFDLWQSAWQIGVHDPLTGAGLGNFGRAMRPYRDPIWTRDGYTSPHNVPLLIWAEEGILGMLALLACIGALFWTAYRRWRTAAGADRMRTAGCIAALVGFSVHNLFDTFVNTTPVMLPVFVIVAYIVCPFEGLLSARSQQWIPRFALAALVAGLFGWLVSDLAQIHFSQAIRLMDSGQLLAALEQIDRSRQLDPSMGLYAAQRAQILGRLASEDDRYVEGALHAYEEALRFEQTYDLLHANYAGLLAHSGDLENALVHMRRAEAIQPRVAQYDFWIGHYAERLGQDEAARNAYLESLNDNWSSAISPYWETSALRSEVRDAFLAEQGLDRLSVDEMAAIPAYCWPHVPPADADHDWTVELQCGGLYDLLISDDGEDAVRSASFALGNNPADGPAYALRAEGYLRLVDLASAEQDARTAVFLGDRRGYYVLGQIAEAQPDFEAAEEYYLLGAPPVTQSQEWDVVYMDGEVALSILPLRG